jgi:DNA-binding HxlR family transcriptional regulator
MKKNPHTIKLGAEKALGVVSDQWFIVIVHALMPGKLRFSELHRAIPGVSKKVLTQTLRNMERDGFVSRTVYPVVPPHTEYQLTQLGESIVPPLQGLCRWANEHFHEVEEHRATFVRTIGMTGN